MPVTSRRGETRSVAAHGSLRYNQGHMHIFDYDSCGRSLVAPTRVLAEVGEPF